VKRYLSFIFISSLILVGCQSESTLTQAGSTLTPTAQHLSQDKKSTTTLDSGNLLVKITPWPLTSTDSAKAVFVNCRETEQYQWLINDKEIYGESGQFLLNTSYNRGDNVTIIAHCGDHRVSHNSVVQNSPPMISEIKFQDPLITSGRDLTVISFATDQDQDLIDFSYEWTVDNNLLNDITVASLPGEFIHKGTSISLAVTPFDGFEYGVTFQSLNFLVPNSSPKFTSTPPPLTSNQYTYNVNATDPDHDYLTFRLEQSPKGMVINEESGQLTWPITQNTQPGTYDIKVIAEDNEGAQSRQFFSLSLSYPE
jgi:Putative Ig domain